MWTEMDFSQARSRATPEVGPLSLAPSPRDASAPLPPLALVFDDSELHRAIARRLVARGFPVAWHSCGTHAEASSAPGFVRGTRARTPRHAAEIAAYLPRAKSRGGGGQPHHATAAAGAAALAALERLAVDSPTRPAAGTSSASPGAASSASPGARSRVSFADELEETTTRGAFEESLGGGTIGSDDDVENRNPLVVFLAVAGDAAMEKTLERLFAGERGGSSAYVDRNLLAGAVLIATGPASETAASKARRRCARAGVSLVFAAPDADSESSSSRSAAADAATEGRLHVWVATASRRALEAALPVVRAIAASAEVVGSDRTRRREDGQGGGGAPRGADDLGGDVAAMRAAGARRPPRRKRRALALERELDAARRRGAALGEARRGGGGAAALAADARWRRWS